MPALARSETVTTPIRTSVTAAPSLEIERRRHIGAAGVPCSERRQSEARLDQFQNGGRVIDGVIDKATFGERRDDQRRNPRARPPAVDDGGRDMVPEAAVLVIGDDDDAVLLSGLRSMRRNRSAV